MDALQRKTFKDLSASPDDGVELIGGEIVCPPMPRPRHGQGQGQVFRDLDPFAGRSDPGDWWIVAEISVAYAAHESPVTTWPADAASACQSCPTA